MSESTPGLIEGMGLRRPELALSESHSDFREVLKPARVFDQVALRLLGRLAPELLTRSCMPGD